MSRTRARLLGAGLTTGALAAAMLVAPQAAFAAPTTVGPNIVAVGNAATINDPAGIFGATTLANTVV
jgi:hypothetical protein